MHIQMYTQLRNPCLDAYDVQTGKFIGEARFRPTKEAEKSILDWINYGIQPKSLIMLDSDFQPAEQCQPITPHKIYHQKGIFKALLKEKGTNEWVPIKVYVTYDWRSRTTEQGNFIRSVEFENVKIDHL